MDAFAEDTLHNVCLLNDWREFLNVNVVDESGWREGIRLVRDAGRRFRVTKNVVDQYMKVYSIVFACSGYDGEVDLKIRHVH